MIPCKIPGRSIGVFNATLHVFSIGVRLPGYWADEFSLAGFAVARQQAKKDEGPRFPGALRWWARLGLNQRPPRCQRGALPLSYAPFGRKLKFITSPSRAF